MSDVTVPRPRKPRWGAILKRYKREVTPSKKTADLEGDRIDVLLRDKALMDLKAAALTGSILAEWRDRRLEKVSGGTVNREIDIISHAINVARKEWKIHIDNPVQLIRRPPKSKARDRRLLPGEEAVLLAAMDGDARRPDGTFRQVARNYWIKSIVLLAIEPAMRRGELPSLRWENVDLERRTAYLPDTKNGEARNVPLSTRAVAVLEALPRAITGQVFPVSENAFKLAFDRSVRRARRTYLKEAGDNADPRFMVGLRFHDLRHEATSRLAERLPNVIELAAVTGHKDLRMLKRYYHPSAEDLARKLG